MSIVRIGASVALSGAFNVALIVSLAELDRPADDDDAHDPHRVAPSVIEPPPPPATKTAASPDTNSATPLPDSPPAPALDLPDPTDVGDGPSLAWGALDDVGLGDLDALALGRSAARVPKKPTSDQPPRMTIPPDLTNFYPSDARRRRLSGRSIVAVQVGADGRVRSARILRSEPPGVFDRAAVRAARSFTFEPAQRAGQAVAGRTRVELKWRLRN